MSKQFGSIIGSLFLIVALLSLMLVSCAKSAPSPAPAPAPAPSPAPAPAPAPAQEAETFKLKTQIFHPNLAVSTSVTFNDFMEKVKLLTGGNLDMSPLLPGGAVCSALDMFDAVSTGLLDVGCSLGSYYTGKIAIGNVESGMDFSYRDAMDGNILMYDRGLLDIFRKEYAKHNIYLVTVGVSDECVLFTHDKRVQKMEDLAGMKIRVTGEPQYAYQEFGASIVVVPYGDMYSAMQYGTIDGMVTDLKGLETMRFAEVAKYYNMPCSKIDCVNIFMNMDTWNKLSDHMKAAVNTMGEMWCWRLRSGTLHAQLTAEEFAASIGCEKVTLPPEEIARWREVAISKGWEWAASQDAASAEAVNIIKEYYKELGVL